VIATTISLTGALLCGWLGGLTAHALNATRWRDPGARAVWLAGAGATGAGALILSTTLSLLVHPAAWLLLLAICVAAGVAAGWQASEALSLQTQLGGDRRQDAAPDTKPTDRMSAKRPGGSPPASADNPTARHPTGASTRRRAPIR
jgi:hypothetical protein